MNELLLEKYAYKKKRSVLSPYIDDIRVLLEHDATQKSILEYLENEQDITVTQAYLSMFIKKHIKGKQVRSVEQKEVKTPDVVLEDEVEEIQQQENVKIPTVEEDEDKKKQYEQKKAELLAEWEEEAERDKKVQAVINKNPLLRPNR